VFAYGTLPEYRQHASTLPPLSPAQLLKLRQLTVVQMADASVSMPYDELMAALEMSSVRELEDVLINECIAPGLVRGKLDQRRRAFEVHSCPVGRDLKPGQLGAIIAGLAAWHDNSKDVLAKLGDQMTWTTEEADRRKEHRKEVDDTGECAAKRDEGAFVVPRRGGGRGRRGGRRHRG
jgi:COP9 signalosome complex subunit 7